ncbi:MAG: valine--tRNA ligase [Candidatus Yanofskybacteria bacterium RIFCSPHIGHO2_02_FULL_38_22b]|uniref:Valine--tRNA ligase n=1 Tax=Candidatus Yanofskybacteria bacterium RIFCSPHIGHO2_02_FULL_38_22b TaxID=1802673 RepID=A0A1F8F0S6_9BACT|nr:MAG: valine--tRNA ligase [Candidatus Yanofskybacteria bacterium RIFCSPHIGHO2_01_FULL_39_44]OGN06298.1 MAG: valine--tRNA ligase [Candidatus Yanofskybacteria bacterium RIFCSPHIGHO2_02_FULL_38_22b]OGN19717.1 MAG: valine--tRNA ligase [Candidatus Yanofskybacteria bacterium RIFCSPLOWO2_01_FULL_39_28]
MAVELEKNYNPKETEERIYKLWEESGYFNPDNLPRERKESFCIIMPPTNANGSLHAGHGLVLTIEDIMTRYKRMRGYKTLWLPGLDHAGFETQVVYEKQLEKEGRSRFQMEPEKLYDEILKFTLNNKQNIEGQTRKIGASCDWSREKFTLDNDVVKTVHQTFAKLDKDGLVYRGKRIINWCPKHQTSLSDLETKDVDQVDSFYYLKYGPFTISTARPETKFGDKYVVMHPKDKRYTEYKDGQKIELEWINGPTTATIIKDESIDMRFGTGAMTITPWHDAVDFEIAERHNLEKEQIIDFRGKLLPIAGEFAGMKITQARPLIVGKLKSKELLVKIDDKYKHVVKKCYKCESLIEPQIKEQWFVKMKPLAEPAIKAIEGGEINFIPEHYKKTSLHWLKNIIDWNVSRQIVWGIPIPAWFHDKICIPRPGHEKDIKKCKDIIISENKPKCQFCDAKYYKDPDTFDTWFSSGQWPFASLGYPDSKDYKEFFPTDVMETAGEIIFFWVARMIILSLYITGKVPFKTVYLHGLVLDAKGQKMSKSKSNVINPLDLTEKYGTDAFRMGLIVGNTPGTSLSLSEDKIKGQKHFSNKLWNISRFILMNMGDNIDLNKKPELGDKEKSYLTEFNELVKDVTKDLDEFRFYLAGEKLYHYIWHTFADKIIEEEKAAIKNNSSEAKWLLLSILTASLKLLHPFMPFVTEEIYSKLPIKNKKLLLVEEWPSADL